MGLLPSLSPKLSPLEAEGGVGVQALVPLDAEGGVGVQALAAL